MFETAKGPADAFSYSALILAWIGVLSAGLTVIATTLAIVWWCIRIYESKTVQGWLAKRKSKSLGRPN